jgi:imidazole glycerol-phosphate synthase subunit HisH
MVERPQVAIIDYHMGNLFSVQRACEWAGLEGIITSDPRQVERADAVILPGVGAFGAAMEALNRTGVSQAIRDYVAAGRPFVGICLGIQLLMSESCEFGAHRGLGIIPGRVLSFRSSLDADNLVKIPQMQWNRIQAPRGHPTWEGTLLNGLPGGTFMYFVHSYYVVPDDSSMMIAKTSYAGREFCSALQLKNVFACQFHPERSGPAGLHIYQSLADRLRSRTPAQITQGAAQ